jgi:hypothetical protein
MNRKTKELPSKPFFTRFLEKQELQDVTGGKPEQTMKYPSDSDETVTANSYHDF